MKMTPAIKKSDIEIYIAKDFNSIKFSAAALKKLIKNICSRFITENPDATRYQINVAIVDDETFRRFHSRFLNRDNSSDCLSFDLSDQWSKVFELIVNGEVASCQASLRKHTVQAELALYVTHGLLHNFGFDDNTPDNAKIMHETEDEILEQNGYGAIYYKKLTKHLPKKNKPQNI